MAAEQGQIQQGGVPVPPVQEALYRLGERVTGSSGAWTRTLGMGAPPFFCGAYGCDCCETQKPPPCTVTVSID